MENAQPVQRKPSTGSLSIERSSFMDLYFDDSVKRLHMAGYDRHFHPTEDIGILIKGREGTLPGSLHTLYRDLTDRVHWLDIAFERQGNTLLVYHQPRGLEWIGPRRPMRLDDPGDHGRYQSGEEFSFTNQEEFRLPFNLNPWHELIKVSLIGEPFQQSMYGMDCRQLEKHTKQFEGGYMTLLPPNGQIAPMQRWRNGFSCRPWADSRGVKDRTLQTESQVETPR